jgi:hypothetical protein
MQLKNSEDYKNAKRSFLDIFENPVQLYGLKYEELQERIKIVL